MHMDNSSPRVAEPCSARVVHAYPQVPPGVPHTHCGKKPLRPASAARDTALPAGGMPRRRGSSPGQTNLTRDAEDAGIAPLPMASSGWTNLHRTLQRLGTQGLRPLIHKFSVQCHTPVVEKRFGPAFATHGSALPAHGDHADRAGQIFTTRCEALGHKGCAPLSTSSPYSAAHRLWKSASGLHSPSMTRRYRHMRAAWKGCAPRHACPGQAPTTAGALPAPPATDAGDASLRPGGCGHGPGC